MDVRLVLHQIGNKHPALVMLPPTFSDMCGEADVCPKVNSGHVGSDCKAHSDTDVIVNVGVVMQPHPQDGFSLLCCLYHQRAIVAWQHPNNIISTSIVISAVMEYIAKIS